jgi:hypothetical protein
MGDYNKTVFINCPFDDDYKVILNYIIFTILYLKFDVNIASNQLGSEHNRLEKIQVMIEDSALSIHDISRLKAMKKGEFYRLNMPLELGMDMGAKRYTRKHKDKKFLIFESIKHSAHIAASDLSGLDPKAHENVPAKAMEIVRDWLENLHNLRADGAEKIEGEYLLFIEDFYQNRRARGFNEEQARNAASPVN